MKYCKKCQKQTPTKYADKKEECMVCGTEIGAEQKEASRINSKLMEEVRKAVKTNEITGEVDIAKKVGRNVFIGLMVMLAGIIYMIGGMSLVFWFFAIAIGGLVVASLILWYLATRKE